MHGLTLMCQVCLLLCLAWGGSLRNNRQRGLFMVTGVTGAAWLLESPCTHPTQCAWLLLEAGKGSTEGRLSRLEGRNSKMRVATQGLNFPRCGAPARNVCLNLGDQRFDPCLHAVAPQGLILSIAINSARHGLLALLIGSNFYEVK